MFRSISKSRAYFTGTLKNGTRRRRSPKGTPSLRSQRKKGQLSIEYDDACSHGSNEKIILVGDKFVKKYNGNKREFTPLDFIPQGHFLASLTALRNI